MKQLFIRLMAASLVTVPAWAHAHGNNQGSSASIGSPTVASSSTATANGGAGGSGGSATGGAATGGAATGGAATGGTASGNSSNVSVSLTTGAGSGDGSSTASTQAKVDYGGSYTIKSAPQIVAPSLTSTFSDTCMGSSSFGLSVVGFGASGGTTMVDEACVRRLDSREFRAMGMNDVALALLCQSPANRQAVESTGRVCPSATSAAAPVASAPKAGEQYTDPFVRRRMEKESADTAAVAAAPATPATSLAATAPAAATQAADETVTVSAVSRSEPDVQQIKEVATGTGN